jgi:hypothetical protein
MYLTKALVAVIGASLLASCASAGPTIVQEAVGPQPSRLSRNYTGYLIVYSATEEHTDGDSPARYPHSDYEVYTRDAKLFKQVRNALGYSDETPERISLPKGLYTVLAKSETAGSVSVPVIIETGKSTVLHLEREKDWMPDLSGAKESDFVRLANGQIIGFRAK